MIFGKPQLYINLLKAFAAVIFIVSFGACVTFIKKFPDKKPFVDQTNINLIGKFSNEEKTTLVANLEDQLDDSIRVRKLDNLLWQVLKRPPVYDSTNADNSVTFMKALLNSLGYFNDSVGYTSFIKKRKWHQLDFPARAHPYETVVKFDVKPGVPVRLDSISYRLRHADLQRVTDSSIRQSFIKKGDPFAKAPISAELDRLTELYRNSGYLRFTRDELIGVWDTLDVSLLQPSLDPFEQFELLQKLKARRENPTANLEIRLKTIDSLKLVKYYIGNVTVYPDYTPDTVGITPKEVMVEGIRVVQHHDRFKSKIFPPNIYLPHDSLYRVRRYIRTINRLSSLGTWRMVSIDQIPREGQDTVDFVIKLTPSKKYSFDTNLEGSINQSAISGSLFGIGLNVGLQNRNFAKSANISNTNIRYGVELGNKNSDQFIQSQQIALGHNIYSPRIIPNFKFFSNNLRDNFRTVLSFNASNTERRLLYNLTSINGSWGYEYQRRKNLVMIKIPNIEYSNLIKRDSLDTLIKYNPSLQNVFTDGLISSLIVNFTRSGGTVNRLNVFRANMEQAGILTGLIRTPFLDEQLYRFIKLDAEFARLIRLPKTSMAFRFYAGAGYELNSTRNPEKKYNLPFFKEYFSGGPNSMRAWALRRLGPGSTIKEFNGIGGTPDRYGDLQLEGNFEYRFPLGKPFGTSISGAVFTDVGNIWFVKAAPDRPEEEIFSLNRLGKDIAIGSGAGLRIDFNFFVLRFDYAYKVKDPSPAPADAAYQNKWFSYPFFKGAQFQLGIGHPFIF